MNVNEWVCVPKFPDALMRERGNDRRRAGNSDADIFCAMLAAAPTPAPVPVDPAELATLRRDAARYRFIRSGKCHVHAIWFQSFGERFNLMESDLDDSVDAALAANGEKVG